MESGNKGSFYLEKEGKKLALMTYVWSGERRIIIDHTEVDEQLKGQGVGKKLIAAAVEFARSESIKILPLCPFAKKVMEKSKEYADVID